MDAVMADEQDTTDTDDATTDVVTDDVEGADDADTTDDAGDDTSAEDEPKLTREEFNKLRTTLESETAEKKKVHGALVKERNAKRDLEKRLKDIERQNEDDTARAQREAEEAALAKYKPIVAENALLAADARKEHVGHLIKLIDLSALEFDGREVVGLDSEIDRLREELPLLFVAAKEDVEPPKPAPKPAPKAAAAPRKPARPEPETAGDAIAKFLLGK